MKLLTLTIVIPVYNEEHYLSACLEAIMQQTEQPDAVIVVDNNSTDQSMAIAASFPSVTIVRESKQGIVYARNRGFDAAATDLIGRIDADTCLQPTWVEAVKHRAASMDSSDAMTGPCRFYDAKWPRLTFAFHRIIYFWSSRLTFGHTILFGSNMFFFRENWQRMRAEACKNNAIHEDMDLAAHIIEAGGRVYFNKWLPAKASARRFHNWRHYPTKWTRTWLTHGLLPARYQSVRQVDEASEY